MADTVNLIPGLVTIDPDVPAQNLVPIFVTTDSEVAARNVVPIAVTVDTEAGAKNVVPVYVTTDPEVAAQNAVPFLVSGDIGSALGLMYIYVDSVPVASPPWAFVAYPPQSLELRVSSDAPSSTNIHIEAGTTVADILTEIDQCFFFQLGMHGAIDNDLSRYKFPYEDWFVENYELSGVWPDGLRLVFE